MGHYINNEMIAVTRQGPAKRLGLSEHRASKFAFRIDMKIAVINFSSPPIPPLYEEHCV